MLNEFYIVVDTTDYEYNVVSKDSGPGAERAALESVNSLLQDNPEKLYTVFKAVSKFSLPRSPVLVERFK